MSPIDHKVSSVDQLNRVLSDFPKSSGVRVVYKSTVPIGEIWVKYCEQTDTVLLYGDLLQFPRGE